jgi:hypothetical protein
MAKKEDIILMIVQKLLIIINLKVTIKIMIVKLTVDICQWLNIKPFESFTSFILYIGI